MLDRASACAESGDALAAALLAELAVQAAAAQADSHAQAQALNALSGHRSELHEGEAAAQAAQAAQAALLLFRALPEDQSDRAGEAASLNLLSKAYAQLGLLREGCDIALQALELARRQGSVQQECVALQRISSYHTEVDELDDAKRLLTQALVLARGLHSLDDVFWCLNNISHVLGLQAARRAAAADAIGAEAFIAQMLPVLDEALALALGSGRPLFEAFVLSNQADVYIVRGDDVAARAKIAQYVAIARAHGLRRLLAYAALDEVRLLVAKGQHQAALQVLDAPEHRALIAEQMDLAIPTEEARYLAHKALGQLELALAHLENYARLERERLQLRAEKQARVLLARLDLQHAQASAERARLDAQVQTLRAAALESERDVLQHKAHEDALTGVGNRRAADERLARAVLDNGPGSLNLVVALLDVDHFKAVNDNHGHAVGDQVLVQLGQLLPATVRQRDAVFRFGGEEFLLLLFEADPQTGFDVCERVRQAVQVFDWPALAPGLTITVSLGLATQQAQDTPASLLARADAALYAAKRGGRNRVQRG
jgi:diguanylate cyclase